jgi:hypothetical protein
VLDGLEPAELLQRPIDADLQPGRFQLLLHGLGQQEGQVGEKDMGLHPQVLGGLGLDQDPSRPLDDRLLTQLGSGGMLARPGQRILGPLQVALTDLEVVQRLVRRVDHEVPSTLQELDFQKSYTQYEPSSAGAAVPWDPWGWPART